MLLKVKQILLGFIMTIILITMYFIQNINLGVDLRGGASILLKVNLNEYYNDRLNTIHDILTKKYKNTTIKNNAICIPNGQYNTNNTDKYINHNMAVKYIEDTAYLSYKRTNHETQNVIDQSIKMIQDRVDPTGTKELVLQKYKNQFIRLQIPGQVDVDEVLKLIGTTAKLNFHIVDTEKNNNNKIYLLEERNVQSNNIQSNTQNNTNNSQKLYVQNKVALDGNLINNANMVFNDINQPIISLSFNNIGSKKFAEITKKYKNHRLAIILDNKIISAPYINQEIVNGQCTISGKFSVDEASKLAYLLQKGALITTLDIVEQNTIGPTLGEYFIQQSYKAVFWIFGIITLFMLVIYKGLGIIVTISLFTTMALLYCCVFLFNITLTLSGIIGILFTIGMAVDANVLINERIRELKVVNSNEVYRAVSKASEAIMDANLTSLIIGLIMYSCGSGIMKAFAIMLCLGIICSVFVAILISHTLLISYVGWFKNHCTFLIK